MDRGLKRGSGRMLYQYTEPYESKVAFSPGCLSPANSIPAPTFPSPSLLSPPAQPRPHTPTEPSSARDGGLNDPPSRPPASMLPLLQPPPPYGSPRSPPRQRRVRNPAPIARPPPSARSGPILRRGGTRARMSRPGTPEKRRVGGRHVENYRFTYDRRVRAGGHGVGGEVGHVGKLN